jgi:hypothetical protein
MNRPRIINSEGVLLDLIKRSSPQVMAKFIRSLNNYITWLEEKYDIEITNESEDANDELQDRPS